MRHSVLSVITSVLTIVVIVKASPTKAQNKYVVSSEKVSFFEGYLRCRQMGLDPAEIITEQDQKDIEAALQSQNDISWELGFWIFATNLGNYVSYYWLNSGLPIFYSTFAPGQPDNSLQKESCLQIFQIKKGVFAWNDMPCDYKLRFICQHKQRLSSTFEDNKYGVL
ncbi:salivary C-type lectin 2-like isoform X1 [Rhynchophorus ferrugineus]|uniref:salivary C-type lectin 2-like isoform X1 n=1 Tax=Rhynchophorus ferrugineus TaxID=354439 RepID=UPI003FCED134